MKIELCFVGKTKEPFLNEGVAVYEKRLKHYTKFAMHCIPDIKNAGKMKAAELKKSEGAQILKRLSKDDYLILLDEKGKGFTSLAFSSQIEKIIQMPFKRIVFQVGGAFGFSKDVYDRANLKIKLSDMTFSHQMIRLFFVEQLYRAFTILRNESYHNE